MRPRPATPPWRTPNAALIAASANEPRSEISSAIARVSLLIAEPDFLGLLLADQVFQIPGAVAGIERAHHRADLAEHRALLGDGDVAHHLQHVAAADREAV